MNDLETRITKLEAILGKGNFLGANIAQKDTVMNGRVKLDNRDSLPSTCAPGEFAVSGGIPYVCSAVNTWSTFSSTGGSVFSSGKGTQTIPFGTVYYADIGGGSASTTETDVGNIMTRAGTIKNLYVGIKSNTLNNSAVMNLEKNGSTVSPSVTISTGSTTTASDTTNSFSVVAGDRITLRIIANGSSGSIVFGFSYQII